MTASRSLRILVVDDDAYGLRLAEYLLRQGGHDVTGVADSMTALAYAGCEAFDVVLTDIWLPDFDGYDLLARCKTLAWAQKTCFVALTALAMSGDRRKAIANGFDDHLSKPIDPDTFVQTVELIATKKLATNAV
jgi:CheY-like chemotaxis protein